MAHNANASVALLPHDYKVMDRNDPSINLKPLSVLNEEIRWTRRRSNELRTQIQHEVSIARMQLDHIRNSGRAVENRDLITLFRLRDELPRESEYAQQPPPRDVPTLLAARTALRSTLTQLEADLALHIEVMRSAVEVHEFVAKMNFRLALV
jgi:hypothetical protein